MKKNKNIFLQEVDGYKFNEGDNDSNYMLFLKLGLLNYIASDSERFYLCRTYTNFVAGYLDKPELSWLEEISLNIIKGVYTSPELCKSLKPSIDGSDIVRIMESSTIGEMIDYIKKRSNVRSYLSDYSKILDNRNVVLTSFDWNCTIDWFCGTHKSASLESIEGELLSEITDFITNCLNNELYE